MRRAAIIVLDGVGIGPAPDAEAYGDAGSNTLGNVARVAGGLSLPELEAFGLGRCASIRGIDPVRSPKAAHGICEPASPGKDSTTGHWEICGLVLETPFPTYPRGFPPEIIDEFARRTGRDQRVGKQDEAGAGGLVLQAWALRRAGMAYPADNAAMTARGNIPTRARVGFLHVDRPGRPGLPPRPTGGGRAPRRAAR